jgi:hypothetical protein
MKTFLMIDDSGRGWTAEWNEQEIRDDIAAGEAGTFAEFDSVELDDDGEPFDVERLSDWLERCGAGDEFPLDAAHLVCTCDVATARTFTLEPMNDNRVTFFVRDNRGRVVAELSRRDFGDPFPYETESGRAAAAKRWESVLALFGE